LLTDKSILKWYGVFKKVHLGISKVGTVLKLGTKEFKSVSAKNIQNYGQKSKRSKNLIIFS